MKHAGTATLLSLGTGNKAGVDDLWVVYQTHWKITLTPVSAQCFGLCLQISSFFFFFFSSQALEDQVWDLLHEADKAAKENKEKSQVYDAMAETLGDAWDALILMLEKRQALLELTSVFFENALEVCI